MVWGTGSAPVVVTGYVTVGRGVGLLWCPPLVEHERYEDVAAHVGSTR